MDQRQESRTEKVAIAVTKTEKTAVRAMALFLGTDESNLVRTTPIADIVAEYRRLQGSAELPEPPARPRRLAPDDNDPVYAAGKADAAKQERRQMVGPGADSTKS